MLGATNAELATHFDVAESTIDLWIRDKPSFRRAVRRGREGADEKVARSLYRRATGLTVVETREVMVGKSVKELKTKKQIAPETTAAGLWLANRQRGKWRSMSAGGDATNAFDLVAFTQALAQIAGGKKDDAASSAQDVVATIERVGDATD